MATSLRLKKPGEDQPPPSPQPQHVAVPSFSGTSIAFGGVDSSDEETPREFFIRTAIDVEFGKENGQFIVRSATIERLVDWITLNHEAPKDQPTPIPGWNPACYQDVHALLRCYPNVCDAMKFFRLFESRFITSGIREEKLQVLKVFQQWIEKYFLRDFINKKTNAPNALCNRLLNLILTRWEEASLREQCNTIKLTILRIQSKLKTGSGFGVTGAKSVAKLDVSNLEKLTADKKAARRLDDRLPEISLLELAGQMSKIEVRIFSRILEKELFDLAWKKPGNRHMCRHILRLIDRSNNVSFWVATQILQESGENSAEKRCNRLKKFIKLAQKCLMLNNFNTLMEILGGINLRPIQRLKATWALVPEKYMTILKSMESLMENRYNYKAYREALKERKPPILPYLGVYLRDLTFIEEGNATFVEKTMINLDKMKLISQVMNDIQEYQSPQAYSSYFPKLRSKERKFLKSGLVGLSEDALYDLSYKAEASTASNASLSTSYNTLPLPATAGLVSGSGSMLGTPKGERPTLAAQLSETRLSSSSLSSRNNSPASSLEESNPLLQRVNSDKSEKGESFTRTNSDRGNQQRKSDDATKETTP